MSVRRVAMLSLHTSPLAQPGAGDGGGMNVYVFSLAAALARAGVECDVLTRAEHHTRHIVEVEPGFRVVNLDVGPRHAVHKHELIAFEDDFVDAAHRHLERSGTFDAIHAHYWVSGAVGHRLKHDLELPLFSTFHTLARAKQAAGLGGDAPARERVEGEIIACSDCVVGSTCTEHGELVTHYDAPPERIEVIPPGVDHTMFLPGDAATARRRLRLPDRPLLLFVGRIQPLKGVDLAIGCLAELADERAVLAVIGGPSGDDGPAEVERLHALAHDLGVEDRVRWIPPQPHGDLADWYRAADVCIVPSRAESFGLVALEAAACGTPVVAASVGGLRCLVADGESGFLVEGRSPLEYAERVDRLLADPRLARDMSARAISDSAGYTWSITAARLRRLYADVGALDLVRCR